MCAAESPPGAESAFSAASVFVPSGEASSPGVDTADPPILRVQNLSKTFVGTRALSNVDIDVRGGELHALVGANGSGKSTLIKILSGYHSPDDGATFWLDGREVKQMELTRDTSRGLGRLSFVHQDPGLIMEFNAIDNLAMRRRQDGILLSKARRRQQAALTRELTKPFAPDLNLTIPVSRLTSVERTIIAIAAALQDRDSERGVLVLDEPTATLPPTEVDRLFQTIHVLLRRGAGILYVSHRLEEIFSLANRITVLRNGECLGTHAMDDMTSDSVIRLMLGGEGVAALTSTSSDAPAKAETALEVRDLAGYDLRGISFSLGKGEVIGVAGYPDSGRDEFPRILTDRRRDAVSGEYRADDEGKWKPIARWKGHEAVLIPPDRLREGVIGSMTVEENLTLSSMGASRSRVFLRQKSLEKSAMYWINYLDIRCAGPHVPLQTLSGGNQQKVLIARAIAMGPRVLVMCEPTAGVDIGARQLIYEMVHTVSREGLGVIIVSSDMDDLVALCSRVVVLQDGLIIDQLSGTEVNEFNLVHAMAKGDRGARRAS
jgi:ABC-type sugar transport system ATPase subunit